MTSLRGRIALVTGGASGIGAAPATALGAAGAEVIVGDIIDGEKAAADIGAAFVRHDVTSEESWMGALAFAKERFGGLDILVNNAGILLMRPLVDTTLAEFRRVQQVNVEGVFLGMKHAIPAIAERAARWSGGGSIVNLSSAGGIVGSARTSAYNASKGAVRLMTKSAALECAESRLNVRINSVHPAIVETPMTSRAAEQTGSALGEELQRIQERFVAGHPIGRLGRPDEIASAIVFLASDAASFMTGSELVVDGGWTAV